MPQADLSDANFINDAVLLSDGSLVTVELRNENDFLMKVDRNGNAVAGFGTEGAIDLGADDLGTSGLALQSDGKLLVRAAGKLSRYGAFGNIDPTFGTNGSVSTTDTLIGIGSDGTIFQQDPPSSDSVYVTRRFAEEGPVGLLSARSMAQVPNRPYEFSVTWRDDDGIDAASLLNGLQIVAPDGETYKAHLLGTIADGSHATLAIYKFAAPGGSWTSADDGIYTIRVRDGKVKDIHGAATSAQSLGQFAIAV
jgi:hypothetical protein